ncbi:lachesin-like isoform X2 [Photinus pyralis]|uniref:lachesin-like isoform X2 n=1 Tax=Photinus pyralis TaxID=7054 RepID=UPI001266F76D|nr:lachesin-like isoform X2 [Photinus pyralis]
MSVRALLLAVLLIEINSSIQVDDSDIARETRSSKNFEKLQKQFLDNTTRLLQGMLYEKRLNLNNQVVAVDEFSNAVKENLQNMVESWSWVPEWWKSVRRWTDSTVRVLNRRCVSRVSNMKAAAGPLLLCSLLNVVSATGQVTELEPEFLAPLENHTVTQGRDVYFTCIVNHLSTYKVAWIKSDSKAILAIHTHMVAQNPRLSVTHNGHNTWMLHVSNVQKNDSGTYMCQINTDPMRSQMGNLEVVIPPDILNDNESTESGGGMAVEGGTVKLRCHATGVPEPSVLWRREDSRNLVLRHEGGREKQVLRSYDGDTLVLNNIQRSDMGPYLCIASNNVPPSVSKRFVVKVHFHPLIRVSNQLVAAPMSSDVVVQCYVEASPRAMNHWMRDETGEKLPPSDKYMMTETALNDYSLLMNLTIRSLERKDFGNYVCTSSNPLGKAEGVVRLQELHLTVKSTSTASTPKYIDVKSRKQQHKEKSKKWKRPKGRKEASEYGDTEEDQEATTAALPELQTPVASQTVTPISTRTPLWILHSHSGVGFSIGDPITVGLISLYCLCRQ